MKVQTSITLLTKDSRGQDKYLAPGEHNLPDEIAKDAIERGFAVAVGKAAPESGSSSDGGQKERSLLQNSIPDIVAKLGELNADELDALAAEESEKGDKARKGVLEAIEAAKAELQGK